MNPYEQLSDQSWSLPFNIFSSATAFMALFFLIYFLLLSRKYALRNEQGKKESRIFFSLSFLFALSSFIFFVMAFLYPIASSTRPLVTLDKNGEVTHIYKHAAWPWDDYVYLPAMPKTKTAIASIAPITENPKVRKLSIIVEFEVNDWRKYLRYAYHPPDYVKVNNGEWDKGEYWIYEFAEANSRELGVFYNPADSEQQNRFQLLARKWLNSRIGPETGIRVKSARFALE